MQLIAVLTRNFYYGYFYAYGNVRGRVGTPPV